MKLRLREAKLMRTTADLLASVDSIRSVLAEDAPKAEEERKLTARAYRAMYDAGLFGLVAPKRFGGLELHPADCLRVWEAVSQIDPSAGWCLVMNQTVAQYASRLPERGIQEIFADGIPTMAGALNPPGRARRVDGGWRVSGRVPFASGCHHTQWLAMPASEEGGTPFGVMFRREDAEIFDTWHTIGMRGTGSADIGVEELFIPDHMVAPVCPLTDPPKGFEGPLFGMWPWTAILGEAVVSVAVAGLAVDAVVSLCKSKVPAYQGTPLKDQQLPQFLLGKAASRVEASRDTLHRAATVAHDELSETGGTLSTEAKLRL